MEVLWAALAICAIVSLVLYALAISWQRMLRSHSCAIRDLLQRIEALEFVENPFVRTKISQLAPAPLEQVHILTFRLCERFWRHTLGATERQVRYVHEHGTFVGSVKIEVWRSHIAITLRELLPQSKSAGWQTRTLDIYDGEPAVLWELALGLGANSPSTDALSVQLRYECKSIILAARSKLKRGWPEIIDSDVTERIVFGIPLDPEQLAEFRVRETEPRNGTAGTQGAAAFGLGSSSGEAKVASFSCQDEQQGFDWQLHIRELNGQATSGHWTIMDTQARRVS